MASHFSSFHCHLPHHSSSSSSSSSSSNHFSSSSSSLPLHHFSKSSLHELYRIHELKVLETREIKKRVDTIKWILGSMEDGEISASAYDTAWVALVEDVEGSDSPQFPSSLEWIAKNQLPDGSWGNTENLGKLEKENAKHILIGFEVAFPSLLDMAHGLGIQVPDNSLILKKIFAMRSVKLTRIPREVMHKVPTSLVHSLEGMSGLDWKQLLKLQSYDGSFLFSPSSTAFALMQTKDQNCLNYLNNVVNKFNGGVPNVYPVDLFEHIWVDDRLQRFGISWANDISGDGDVQPV
ncbi:hypothetical protein RJT34_20105 [Clitoria ternatea]|uniref:Uncharacterized protein n=1 Tax=Clitoria ternatea TaxID=43366 RepID=A0AAN9ISB4_CLITE